jgi:hypothetical protein
MRRTFTRTTNNTVKNKKRQASLQKNDCMQTDDLGLPTKEYMECMTLEEMDEWINSVGRMLPDDAFIDMEW